MRVAFRTDASVRIGSGHVMRCLALAARLRAAGADVLFVCRAHEGHLGDAIRAAGHRLALLPAPDAGQGAGLEGHAAWLGLPWEDDAAQAAAVLQAEGRVDWLVVDHYGLDARWEQSLRAHAGRIFAIDDLADRPHDADLLLDQNLNDNMARRYDGLLPMGCASLLGPRHALLRDEFAAARATMKQRDGELRRLLVFFGGVDATNETAKALDAIAMLGRPDIAVDVVVGAANPHRDAIAAKAATLPQVSLHGPQRDMAPLMLAADLAMGAGGGTMWERCCLGLPTVVLALADNQVPASRTLAGQGIVLYLGPADAVDAGLLSATLKTLAATPALLRRMSEAGAALVDGRGIGRVLARLTAAPIVLRRATENDAESMYHWRNDPSVRRFAGQTDEFSLEQHLAWFRASLANPDRILLIGELDGKSIGVLRYDCDACRATISVYLVPGCIGQGLGARLIDAGSEWLCRQRPQIEAIDAHIRVENGASLQAFAAAGFEEQWQIRTRDLKDRP